MDANAAGLGTSGVWAEARYSVRVHQRSYRFLHYQTHFDEEADGSHWPWSGRRMRLREAVRLAARRVRDNRGRAACCKTKSGQPAAPLNKVLAGSNCDLLIEVGFSNRGYVKSRPARLPVTTVRYDDARQPGPPFCSDRRSKHDRSRRAACRFLADSSPRLAGSTAHTRIAGVASCRSLI